MRAFAIAMATLTLCACVDDAQMATLEGRIRVTEEKITTLQKKYDDLSGKVLMAELTSGMDEVAYLTPGSSGYSIIKSDLGYLTVALKNIQPYANGSRITLQFGNLTSATVDGLKANLEWGKTNGDGLPLGEAKQTREISFNESLPSGAWTDADVVLEGVPPVQLGYVRLKGVGHRGVRLRRSLAAGGGQ